VAEEACDLTGQQESRAISVEISADFFNIFNHVNFFDPATNINSPANFGVISTELIPANRTQGSRWIELGLRVSF